MNIKSKKDSNMRFQHILIGIILIALVGAFSFKSYSERIRSYLTDTNLQSSQQIIDLNGHVIDVEYTLDVREDNFTWLVKSGSFQVLSQGVAHRLKNSIRLEILSGEFVGAVDHYNQDILFQWLKTKTAGQEVLLMSEGQCWRIDGILILLCPV